MTLLRKVKYTLRKVSFTKGRVPVKNYVRDKRMELGLTQDELSEKLEVSRQTIISLEKGKYNPSIQLAFIQMLYRRHFHLRGGRLNEWRI